MAAGLIVVIPLIIVVLLLPAPHRQRPDGRWRQGLIHRRSDLQLRGEGIFPAAEPFYRHGFGRAGLRLAD